MLLFRVVGLLLLLAIALCVGAALITGQRQYIHWAKILFRIAVAVAVAFVALLLIERLIAPIL